MAGIRQDGVRVLTWARLQEATLASPVCMKLSQLIQDRLPDKVDDWPEVLQPYFPHRSHFTWSDGVVMCGDRPLIPTNLHQEVLEHLHTAHQGTSKMLGQAWETIFWPGLTADIMAHRASCESCTKRTPSNPAGPPLDPAQPASHLAM